MNELYFRVENAKWQATKPTALRFDELFESLAEDLSGEERTHFREKVTQPLHAKLREAYNGIARSITNSAIREFKLPLPLDILLNAENAMHWYVREKKGEYSETAQDLLEAMEKAKVAQEPVFICGE